VASRSMRISTFSECASADERPVPSRTRLARVAIAAALVCGLSVPALAGRRSSRHAQPPETATRPLLYTGLTLDQPTKLGETRRYDVVLDEGTFLELRVSQDRVLVKLSLLDENGTSLRVIDIPEIDPFPERLMFKASASGRFTVDVDVHSTLSAPSGESWVPRNTPPRGYVLEVVAVRPSRPDDDRRLAWFDAMTQAEKLARAENMASLQQSIPLLQQTARNAGDPALEATTLEVLAHVTAYFTELHAYSVAARERLTELYPLIGFPHEEVLNWRRLAVEYSDDGRLDRAKSAVSHALDLSLARGFPVNVALCQRDLGVFEFGLGNYDRARDLAQRAQSAAIDLPLPALEALTLWDLARLDELAGDLDAALTRCRRGVEVGKGNALPTSLITLWLGFLHLSRGELDEAASEFQARLDMTRFAVQRDQQALAHVGLGDVLLARGDRAGARQRYETAAAALERGAQTRGASPSNVSGASISRTAA
jgi:tetratricopeptide (TPR) repeat protein